MILATSEAPPLTSLSTATRPTIFEALDSVKLSLAGTNQRKIEDFNRLQKNLLAYKLIHVKPLVFLSMIVLALEPRRKGRQQTNEQRLLSFFFGLNDFSAAEFGHYFQTEFLENPKVVVTDKSMTLLLPLNETFEIHYKDIFLLQMLFDVIAMVLHQSFFDQLSQGLSDDISSRELKNVWSSIAASLRQAIKSDYVPETTTKTFLTLEACKRRLFIDKKTRGLNDEEIFLVWKDLSVREKNALKKFEKVVLHVTIAGSHEDESFKPMLVRRVDEWSEHSISDADSFSELDGYEAPAHSAGDYLDLEQSNNPDYYDPDHNLKTNTLTADQNESTTSAMRNSAVISPCAHLDEIAKISKAKVKYLLGTQISQIRPFMEHYNMIHFRSRTILRRVAFKPVQDWLQNTTADAGDLHGMPFDQSFLDEAFTHSQSYKQQIQNLELARENLDSARHESQRILREINQEQQPPGISRVDHRPLLKRKGFSVKDIPESVEDKKVFSQMHEQAMKAAGEVIDCLDSILHEFATISELDQWFITDSKKFEAHFRTLYFPKTLGDTQA